MRQIVLDTETTGLNHLNGDRVLEIGAVEIVHQIPTGKVFHEVLDPERDVSADAVAVHGYTSDDLKGKPVFAEIVDDLLSFLGESPLVIHNAEFDLGFLNAELSRLGRAAIELDRVVDTLALARKKHPGLPNNLDALCDRYRIDRSRRLKHGALLDAEILVEVYCELAGGRQHALIFDNAAEIPAIIAAAAQTRVASCASRICLLERDEAAAHLDFLGTLGAEAMWLRYMTPNS